MPQFGNIWDIMGFLQYSQYLEIVIIRAISVYKKEIQNVNIYLNSFKENLPDKL